MAQSPSTAPRHPIGVVSRRTGLKRELIRAWERRYAAVEPERTDSNRRLYSDHDVERLALLRQVTELDHNISQVADLPNGELVDLLEQENRFPTTAAGGSATSTATGNPASDPGAPNPGEGATAHAAGTVPGTATDDLDAAAEEIVTAALDAVRRLDERELAEIFERASLALSGLGVVGHVISPLMRRVGTLWAEGVLRPVHEHLAAAAARTYITALLRGYHPVATAPRLVATTPSGQLHELGALIAAAVAAAQGWQVTYLGPDLPAAEIAAAAHARDARVVALSLLYPADDPHMAEELRRLTRLLPQDTELVVGGAGSAAYSEVLDELEVRRAEELPQIHQLFASLRSGSAVPG